MIQFRPSEAQDLDPQQYVPPEQPPEAILCGASSTNSVPPSSTKQPSSTHCLWSLLQVWSGRPLLPRVSPEPASESECSTPVPEATTMVVASHPRRSTPPNPILPPLVDV